MIVFASTQNISLFPDFSTCLVLVVSPLGLGTYLAGLFRDKPKDRKRFKVIGLVLMFPVALTLSVGLIAELVKNEMSLIRALISTTLLAVYVIISIIEMPSVMDKN
ncbi:MAG: hypothetical protein AAF911_04610 [Planctomycetota bacterium]